jgi:hypothetical protein
MHTAIKTVGALLLLISVFTVSENALAQTFKNIDVHSLLQKATVSFAPRTGSFTEGSTFQVPISIDTEGQSINAIELHINFNPKRLQIVEPTGQQSIIGLWVEPPAYSNTFGTLKLVGTIPGGITTKSGLVASITFKALAPGDTRLTMSSQSQVLANDGLGTRVVASFGDALYTIALKPPEGPNVFSETHPFPDHWYNNNTPVMNWDKDPGVLDYSYVVDDQPFTIPGNTANTADNRISLPNLPNGISYFHIKARKGVIWGGTTNFTLRIDTLPPAAFIPTYEKLSSGGTLVSFFTTDSLSGIDHYEVGVIDTKESTGMTPIFVQAQSPFQLPTKTSGDMRVVVRAIDVAGNVRDGQLDIAGFSFLGFLQENVAVLISILLLIITILVLVSHYLFVRRVSRALRMAMPTQQPMLATQQTPYPELPPAQPNIPAQYVERNPKLDVLIRQTESPA